jgi:hypothetical protein
MPDPVFGYLTGQSNARDQIAIGMESSAQWLNVDQERHTGSPIENWYSTEPKDFLYYDYNQYNFEEMHWLIWFQGESDPMAGQEYYDAFLGIRQFYKSKFGMDLKFLILQVWSPTYDLSGVRDVQSQLAFDFSDIYIMDTKPYTRLDAYHMDNETYRDLGNDIAAFLASVNSW